MIQASKLPHDINPFAYMKNLKPKELLDLLKLKLLKYKKDFNQPKPNVLRLLKILSIVTLNHANNKFTSTAGLFIEIEL